MQLEGRKTSRRVIDVLVTVAIFSVVFLGSAVQGGDGFLDLGERFPIPEPPEFPQDSVQSRPFIRGDANGSGIVDSSDAIATLSKLFLGNEDLACTKAADVNDDGQVDIADPITTLTILFLGGHEMPGPYPDCGVDPTPDSLECESYSGCPPDLSTDSFQVSLTKGGYVVDLPRDLLDRLPEGAQVEVTLDNLKLGRTTISGLGARLTRGSLHISTADRFKVMPGLIGETWMLVKVIGAGGAKGPGEPPCSGCPRDDNMEIYGDESICWCFAEPATLPGPKPIILPR